MTQEQFERITDNCQPHNVFSSDWTQYRSGDFADSLLPDAGLLKGEAFRFYDGAGIIPTNNRFLKRLFRLSADGKFMNLTMYSYPKGVKAERKKECILPGRNEICVFFEINADDSINVFMRFGDTFKESLRSSGKTACRRDSFSSTGSNPFATTLSDFHTFFSEEISHHKMFSFLGELMGIDLTEISEKTGSKVHVINVEACTSEPCGNKNRKDPVKKRMQLRVDFEIKDNSITQYKIVFFWRSEILYELHFIPNITITPNNEAAVTKGTFTAGKRTEYWDCTEFMFIREDENKLTVRIEAKDQEGKISISEKTVSPSGLFEKPRENNYIVVLGYDDNEQFVYGDDIIRRQESFIERIPKKVYDTLSDKHKLILHLPEIMVKLDWLHGALCQIHWLEGSGKSLKFPYEFFMSEKRVEEFDMKNLREYFKGIRYLSFENLGYIPSNPEGENLFLYNDTSELPVIVESLNLFHENLSKREDCGPVGGTEIFKIEKSDPNTYVNETLFLSYSLGSKLGDFDDIGTALGRYSLRCYYQGWLDKNYQLGQWVLNVESVKCRFFDDFNFDDDNPKRSQFLGYWKNDTKIPEPPVRYKLIFFNKNNSWLKLENASFNSLREILHKVMKNSCYDFYIHSDIKIIDDEFIKKNILIL